MRPLALVVAAGTALVAVTGGAATAGPPAAGAGASCTGVTVVVDGGVLDTETSTGTETGSAAVSALGCAEAETAVEDDGPTTAHHAFLDVGLSLEGTQQWGAAFVCRVDGRPAVDEDVLRSDGSTGRETCQRTPSQGAYWSLWTSRGGSTWVYADRGATALDVEPGEVVGLSFVTTSQPEPPRVDPADALSGRAPAGWRVLGETAGRTEVPSSSVDVADGATDQEASSQSPGVVPLLGAALAVLLLGAAAARSRSRRA